LLHDELPVIPVAWFEHTVAVSPRLRDVAIDPYEMRYLAEAMVWG
jgi:peptide/nickel transport system substrate-binding protein